MTTQEQQYTFEGKFYCHDPHSTGSWSGDGKGRMWCLAHAIQHILLLEDGPPMVLDAARHDLELALHRLDMLERTQPKATP